MNVMLSEIGIVQSEILQAFLTKIIDLKNAYFLFINTSSHAYKWTKYLILGSIQSPGSFYVRFPYRTATSLTQVDP